MKTLEPRHTGSSKRDGGEKSAAAAAAASYPSVSRSMETTHRTVTLLRGKLALVGDAHVGKSALVSMMQNHTFPKSYVMNTEISFSTQTIPIEDTSYSVELFIYDMPGQSIFNQRLDTDDVPGWDNIALVALVYDVRCVVVDAVMNDFGV